MEELRFLTKKIDSFFQLSKFDRDPTMSRVLPLAYDSIGFDWKSFFEPAFVRSMNGLMIAGDEAVYRVFIAVYPSREVLDYFLKIAGAGDFLFLHHPIPLECGDPEGGYGHGYLPVLPELLMKLRNARVSLYVCHAPLDTNKKISTTDAIAEALNGKVFDWFLEHGFGYAGRMCRIAPLTVLNLTKKLKKIFNLPYLEVFGNQEIVVSNLGIIAGTLGSVKLMKMVEARGADCYLTGEVVYKLGTPEGVIEREKIEAYLDRTRIAHIGVSHAASDFLVLQRGLRAWISESFKVKVEVIPEAKWWR